MRGLEITRKFENLSPSAHGQDEKRKTVRSRRLKRTFPVIKCIHRDLLVVAVLAYKTGTQR